ncbi:MAG: hypothetical protein JWM53_4172 [bacterium]|nr:hypothetical protein [bacterium]
MAWNVTTTVGTAQASGYNRRMRIWGILVMLTTSAPAWADAKQADAAYEAKQFARCGELYQAAATAARGEAAVDPWYNAACCWASDAKADKAFAALEQAVGAGFRDPDHLQADTDLTSLHADARWPKLVRAVEARVAAWEKSLGDPALRRELLALAKEDQAARQAFIGGAFEDKAAGERLAAVDRKTTARMKEVVAKKGWPGKSLVGSDGAFAAWLLVQHADADPSFQNLCLDKMEAQVKRGEAVAKDWAYLVDRVAVAQKRKQIYGTQFDPKQEPRPIEDEAHVDERRAAVGLPSMAAYKEQMRKMYGPPK